MTNNPYKSPESDPLAPEFNEQGQQFYVVSKLKFTLLYFSTWGFYAYYWLFINWYRHRKSTGVSVWPIARALFPIFFTHTLIFAIDERLKEKKIDHKWNPPLWATMYVLSGLAYGIFTMLNEFSFGNSAAHLKTYESIDTIIHCTTILIDFFILLQVQKAINVGHSDPTGFSNNRLTIFNYAWMLAGLLVWAISFIALAHTYGLLDISDLLVRYTFP